MNISRVATFSLALAVAVFALGNVNTAYSAKPDCTSEPPPDHPKCNKDDGGEDPQGCVDHPCIASVGKWHGRAASEYAEANGTYTKISSSRFGKILAKDDFSKLCADYDVLIFEWDSPNIKNLNWGSLESYMACGGGIIWEDTTNIVKLDGDLTVVISNHDSSAPSPIEVTFDGNCFDKPSSLCAPNSPAPAFPTASPFSLVNSHIEFTGLGFEDLGLEEYLIHVPGPEEDDHGVLGLYGIIGDGCIVMTGPDNNFHGDADYSGPNELGPQNMHALLENELDWLLNSTECKPSMM
ncbi:exported protein of unknown function [uncultured Woeseiaceae bacterium]|uniref:Uncharacterized protein n=1 Tax=uncultured Woeseiaceae bacterium TaxID=1983305 RepID=A0A7D9H4M2_9GAMM|nr:exported protein of unknown function [uncultured Woeseiaceae bacterium]